MPIQIKGAYGGALAKRFEVPVTREFLDKMAKCIINNIVTEGKKDFAKRGWSLSDPMGGPTFPESFSHEILGERTIQFYSSWWGLKELVEDDIPSRKMTWLTQEGQRRRGGKMPLKIPLEDDRGVVIFRTAPLQFKDAWVHPGIARFTFWERAMKKARTACGELALSEFRKFVTGED